MTLIQMRNKTSNLKKKINSLLNKLRLNEQSILFAEGDGNNKKNLKSISKSGYVKDKVFFNFYNNFIKGIYLKVVSATFVLVYFFSLNESTCQTVFSFTSKALFVLEKIKF